MPTNSRLSAAVAAVTILAQTPVSARSLEVKRYNPSDWAKGRFTENRHRNRPEKDNLPRGRRGRRREGTGGTKPADPLSRQSVRAVSLCV